MQTVLNAISRAGQRFSGALYTPAPKRIQSVEDVNAGQYRITQAFNPGRSVIYDAAGWVATFTAGARTVTLRGRKRAFAEPTFTSTCFVTDIYVRLLPAAFDGVMEPEHWNWLSAKLADTTPDIVAVAMQYVSGAPAMFDPQTNLQYAGDASYGPEGEESADWNDYLGIAARYEGVVRTPRSDRRHALDSAGFIRMVWGYRGGMPLGDKVVSGQEIPRSPSGIFRKGPGVVLAAHTLGQQLTDLSSLQAGDLVFFDTEANGDRQIDHVGMFIGLDARGDYRFISSRPTTDGPAFGADDDPGRKAILNGGAGRYWPARLRAARRF